MRSPTSGRRSARPGSSCGPAETHTPARSAGESRERWRRRDSRGAVADLVAVVLDRASDGWRRGRQDPACCPRHGLPGGDRWCSASGRWHVEAASVIQLYDRSGEPVDSERWYLLFHDRRYQLLAHTRTDGYVVSTIWLGIDHSFGDGPPLIFETMVFGPGNVDNERRLYATEQEALAGHEERSDSSRRTSGCART